MGASPLMSLGSRAMTASYAALQTTGHNIANANVEGFSRQQVVLATTKGQYTGAGFFGKGADVVAVERAHDAFLTRAAATARSLSSMDAARAERLGLLEPVFVGGEAGIGYAMNQFLNSMSDLAARPADSTTRQVVLARAQDLTTRFNSAAGQIDVAQANVTADMRTSVTAINGIATSIAAVNDQIAALRGIGQPPNDLLDERDRLVNQLSSHVQVSTVGAEDGTLGVFIAGGQRLVLGNQASQLEVVLDPADGSRSAIALVDYGNRRVLDPEGLGGGSLAGLMRFQNDDLVDARNLIGQMAVSLASVVNAQQQLGVSLQQPLGSVAAQPLFAVGGPVALPNTGNARDAGGNYVASVSLTVTDATALQAADYELKADLANPGSYLLTRLSNPPQTRSVASGDVVDGLRIDIGTPAPGPTDRFLLKPLAQAAPAMQVLLQDPRDLAAASPLVATTAPANTGTAAVAQLTLLSAPPSPGATTSVTFTSDNGDYAWELRDAGNALISSGTGIWSAGQAIPPPPTDINGFALQLTGVPRNGDVVSVAPTPVTMLSSNNGNAVALAALREMAFVGRRMAAGGSTSGGQTASDAFASAMSEIGVRVQSAKSGAAISAAVADQAEAARSSVAGVNLDEEAARLIQYQQSYQAAAKVLQIAQSIFQTLLDTATS
jgi:flagellar hook-associated protein 1 FlgK